MDFQKLCIIGILILIKYVHGQGESCKMPVATVSKISFPSIFFINENLNA